MAKIDKTEVAVDGDFKNAVLHAVTSFRFLYHQNSIRYRSLAFVVEAAIVGGTVEYAVVAAPIRIECSRPSPIQVEHRVAA